MKIKFTHNSDANFASIQRQLNLYGFRSVCRGEVKGLFSHPTFIRGRYDDIVSMQKLVRVPKPEPSCAEGVSPAATVRKQKRKRVESCLESAIPLPTLVQNGSVNNCGNGSVNNFSCAAADSATTQKTLVDLESSRSVTFDVLNSIDEVCFDLFCNDILSMDHISGGKNHAEQQLQPHMFSLFEYPLTELEV